MKRYKLISNQFEVQITSVGAEICSFKNTQSGKEYIWQGDPKIWGSHAPVLFPIVGGLKNDTYFFENKTYQLPRHGFIRRNEHMEVITQNTRQLVLQLKSSGHTKQVYPFDFVFEISFELLSNQLMINHRILNTGDQDMYFSLGAHPAFNCPLDENKKYEDYHLEFEQTESLKTWNLDENGQIKEEGDQIMEASKTIALHPHLFDQDALIFKSLKSKRVSLFEQEKELIRVDFEDFKSLGIWAKPGAPFVCIEPWLGYADSFSHNQQLKDKEGIIRLEEAKTFYASYSISITE